MHQVKYVAFGVFVAPSAFRWRGNQLPGPAGATWGRGAGGGGLVGSMGLGPPDVV